MRKNEDEILSAYVSSQEPVEDGQTLQAVSNAKVEDNHSEQIPTPANTVTKRPTASITPVENEPASSNTEHVKTMAEYAHEQRWKGKPEIENAPFKFKDNLGWISLPVESLPTGGLFYPKDTKILIRAARGAEIKHWSTMNDQDLNQLSQVDDILNYIIEKCVNVTMSGVVGASWKDLKDVDRFYLLLAIREFTFIDGNNDLMVPVSEGKEIPVTKEMINFIEIPEELMKYYSDVERCFVFNIGNNTLRMYIPSLGATQWLKNYAQVKNQAREGFDQDFLIYAPMLIKDFRGLTQRAYEEMVGASSIWSVEEWSLVANVRDALMAVSEPKIKYTNDDGAEVTIPLTFRGGLKSIFLVQNSLFNIR